MEMASKNALLSVYDKTGIADFAGELRKLGWSLYASSGTARTIKEAGIEVNDVADLVSGKAILGHRVVTLSREISAGLLATDSPEDQKELEGLGVPRIDLVCVDMYPLKAEIEREGSTENSIIEQTDIGGPTLIRAAAKGRRITLSSASQRTEVIAWLKNGKPEEENFLRKLVAEAEASVANYCLESARYHGKGEFEGSLMRHSATAKYGENPWQEKALLYTGSSDDSLALDNFKLEQGTEPSYNNYCDVDRQLQTITHIAAAFDKNYQKVPFIAIGGKHGNACGASVGDSEEQVVKKMLEGDLRAIFGGIVTLNFPIDETIAELLLTHKVDKGRRLLDGIIAPAVSEQAKELLNRKKDKCRLLTNPHLKNLTEDSLDTHVRSRYVRGGQLIQDNYTFVLSFSDEQLEKHGDLNETQEKDLLLAWAVGSTSNSNTITLVKDAMLIGNGVGQQDRVSAAELALKRAQDAGHSLEGALAYSDSFFPFPDGPQALADSGIKGILTSSGSVGDPSVIEAMKKAGVTLYMIPDKYARGFYAH